MLSSVKTMTPTIVLYECIVQRRYVFFVKLCFDNIMSIIMKVSYMKSNNIVSCIEYIFLLVIFTMHFCRVLSFLMLKKKLIWHLYIFRIHLIPQNNGCINVDKSNDVIVDVYRWNHISEFRLPNITYVTIYDHVDIGFGDHTTTTSCMSGFFFCWKFAFSRLLLFCSCIVTMS
jgi:hypothetical protein